MELDGSKIQRRNRKGPFDVQKGQADRKVSLLG